MTTFADLRTRAEAVWAADRPTDRPWLTVGLGWCGLNNGAQEAIDALRREVAERGLDVVVGQVGCNGMCWAEPLVEVSLPGRPVMVYGPIRAEDVSDFAQQVLVSGGIFDQRIIAVRDDEPFDDLPPLSSLDFFRQQERRLLERSGVADPESLDHALALGAYQGLERALAMEPTDVIKEMNDSGLGGRGGAFFPAGRKWDFLRTAAGSPKYLLCNADEGDPGAFVNRLLLEGDPHLVIEGMLIAAKATGAEYGYIYIRSEYPLAIKRMRLALEQARASGLVGQNVLGSGLNSDLSVIEGAGSYVVGEETGLIASIDEGRAMPRIKPPFPANAGVFMKPTNVNNTETYACAAQVMQRGAAWFAEKGTERYKGTKLFSLTGNIARMGVVEVPMGTPLRVLIEEMGGGAPGGRTLKAVQPGGPLSGVLPASMLDIVLEPPPFAAQGLLMGSGGLVALDERTCMVDLTRFMNIFNQDESCARCTTCRIGNMRIVDITGRITTGKGKPEDTQHLRFLDTLLRNGNCLHGQFSGYMLMSALKFYPEEFDAHIEEQRCPAGFCPELLQYEVEPTRATEVGPGAAACPVDAFVAEGRGYWIDQSKCVRCGVCAELCPPGSIRVTSPGLVGTAT